MRAAEFLRALADTLDRAETPAHAPAVAPVIPTAPIAPVQDQPVVVAIDSAPSDEQVDSALDTDKFVAPLQQKIEIMKKMAGIPHKDLDAVSTIIDKDEPFEG